MIRPLNYPKGTPGKGTAMIEAKNGARVLVINAMAPHLHGSARRSVHRDRPRTRRLPAEARRRRHPGRFSRRGDQREAVDGRTSWTAGSASWSAPIPMCPTADHQILPGGTAFQSDAGMTGDYDSVIGMVKDEPVTPLSPTYTCDQVRGRNGSCDPLRPCHRDRRCDRTGQKGGCCPAWRATGGGLAALLAPGVTRPTRSKAGQRREWAPPCGPGGIVSNGKPGRSGIGQARSCRQALWRWPSARLPYRHPPRPRSRPTNSSPSAPSFAPISTASRSGSRAWS